MACRDVDGLVELGAAVVHAARPDPAMAARDRLVRPIVATTRLATSAIGHSQPPSHLHYCWMEASCTRPTGPRAARRPTQQRRVIATTHRHGREGPRAGCRHDPTEAHGHDRPRTTAHRHTASPLPASQVASWVQSDTAHIDGTTTSSWAAPQHSTDMVHVPAMSRCSPAMATPVMAPEPAPPHEDHVAHCTPTGPAPTSTAPRAPWATPTNRPPPHSVPNCSLDWRAL